MLVVGNKAWRLRLAAVACALMAYGLWADFNQWGAARAAEAPVAPVITNQPASLVVRAGTDIEFNVGVTGTPPLAFQWRLDNSAIGGATNIALTIINVQTNQAGSYTVVVTNAAGSVTSSIATLVVLSPITRAIEVRCVQTNADGPVVISLDMNAQGNERMLAGSIWYNPAVLSNPEVSLAFDAENTNVVRPATISGQTRETGLMASPPPVSLVIDTNHVDQGHLGFRIELPTGKRFQPGLQRLLRAVLAIAPATSLTNAALTLADDPVAIELEDIAGNSLPLAAVVVPNVVPAPSPPVLDLQSGLLKSWLTLLNPGSSNVANVRILVLNLGNDSLGNPIKLYNASGRTNLTETNVVPYIQFGPVPGGSAIDLNVEFYASDRITVPAPEYQVLATSSVRPYILTTIQPVIDRALFTNSMFIVEFNTITNRLYYVHYADSADSTNWIMTLPAVVGTGSRVQWIDDGPPKTGSKPLSSTNRFYRVILFP